jgi:hypothetical protein
MRDFHSYLRDTPFLDSLRSNAVFIPLGRAQGHHSDDSLNAEMTGGSEGEGGRGAVRGHQTCAKGFRRQASATSEQARGPVISIYPGQTASPMQARLYQTAQKTYVPERPLQPSDVAEVVLSVLSLPTSAEVTEIAMRLMCSPRLA